MEQKERVLVAEEVQAPKSSGMLVLILTTLGYIIYIACLVFAIINVNVPLIVASGIMILILGWIPYCGLKILRPNEAYVLTLFGKYYGTLKGPGFYFVNPFTSAFNPAGQKDNITGAEVTTGEINVNLGELSRDRRISLKTLTLSNNKQKINDKLGNPIEIGIVVVWRVVNTAQAVFNVDNYAEFLSIQCDSALRNIVRLYPYDTTDEACLGEKSLRGSSIEIAENLKEEIQEKVEISGVEILEARITSLAYAPEIAAAMLQRQQASAIVDARQLIVEGAVGMVEQALKRLHENQVITLDEERKAAMVSNLLVVLCGNRDAQPVVNSGSLY